MYILKLVRQEGIKPSTTGFRGPGLSYRRINLSSIIAKYLLNSTLRNNSYYQTLCLHTHDTTYPCCSSLYHRTNDLWQNARSESVGPSYTNGIQFSLLAYLCSSSRASHAVFTQNLFMHSSQQNHAISVCGENMLIVFPHQEHIPVMGSVVMLVGPSPVLWRYILPASQSNYGNSCCKTFSNPYV